MAEDRRNLCAQVPAALHSRVRQEQEASGKNLSDYMTWLITEFYENGGKHDMAKGDQRTVAFQVDPDLFERFKEYLKRHDLKQNAFFLSCIQRALEEDSVGAETE